MGPSPSSFSADGQPKDGWAVVHCAREPWHREALRYTGRGAPRDHHEYLLARRDRRLILNLVDVADFRYVAPEIISAAMAFIAEHLAAGRNVISLCNQGHSRGPTVALLYLASIGQAPLDFEEAEEAFRKVYPLYQPGHGMRDFASMNWDEYQNFAAQNQSNAKNNQSNSTPAP